MRPVSIIIAGILLSAAALALAPGTGLAAMNQPAQVIGMPFISTDCAIYAMPASFGGFLWTEFNSTSLTQRDLENLDIDFPLLADISGDKTVLGPTEGTASADGISPGAGPAANVLPFGPVDLAFPSIRQTSDQSIEYRDTYFFSDTLGAG
jgi:hypothetical protein